MNNDLRTRQVATAKGVKDTKNFKLGISTIIGNFTFGIEEQFFYKWNYIFDMKT